MRLQYAVICHEFQDGQWDGVTNLLAVHHKLFLGVPLNEDTPADVPLKLVVSLIDGQVGQHRVYVNIRRPSGAPGPKVPLLTIDWDEASPTFFVVYDILLGILEEGTYEFTVLVDGEPICTVPLPVELMPRPG